MRCHVAAVGRALDVEQLPANPSLGALRRAACRVRREQLLLCTFSQGGLGELKRDPCTPDGAAAVA